MNPNERQQLEQICRDLFKVEVDVPATIVDSTFEVSVVPDWDLFGSGVTLGAISLTFPDDFANGEKDFALRTSLNWDTTTLTVELTATVHDGQPKELGFSLQVGRLSSTDALQKLGSLFQATEDAWEVPDIFPEIGITVEEFSGRFSLKSGLVSFRTILIAEFGKDGKGWSPLTSLGIESDLFALQAVVLAVTWEKGFRTSWQVGGRLAIEQAYLLTLEYAYPLHRVYARLEPQADADKKLETLFSDLGIPSEVGDVASDVLGKAALTLDVDLKRKSFELKFANHGDGWKVLEDIEVSSTELRIYWLDGAFAVAELFLELSLPLGAVGPNGERDPVTVQIAAGYDKANSLWTFEGQTGDGDEIAVGDAIDALVSKLGGEDAEQELPEAIRSLALEHLYLSFDSAGNAEFTCETTLEVEGQELQFWVHLVRQNKTLQVSGSLVINDLQLSVAFSSTGAGGTDGAGKYLVGSLLAPLTADSQDLVAALAPDLASSVPFDMSVHLTGLLFALHLGKGSKAKDSKAKDSTAAKSGGKASQKDYLFRLSFSLDFGLDGFPLIGEMLEDVRFADGQLLVAKPAWKHDPIQEVNGLLTAIEPEAPAPLQSSEQLDGSSGIAKGVTLSGTFQVTRELGFPLFLQFGGGRGQKRLPGTQGDSKPGSGQTATPAKDTTPTKQGARASRPSRRSQSKVNQVVGAVRIKKVGLIFDNGRIGLKITGGLSLATFEFELMGLQVTVPQGVLNDPELVTDIAFGLDGFGIAIRKNRLSILAAFLRQHHEEVAEDGTLVAYDEFSGIVQVAFTPLSLAGMGSYAKYRGHPSLFLFVALGLPIPVHPSLLIQGACLGFGIHRDFITPPMDEILTYPLVAVSVTPPPPIDIAKMAEDMHRFFPPALDTYFVVAGVKFRAFGIVDNLVMVAVKFGRAFELALIGISSIQFPTVLLELAWMARFVPADGYLLIRGQLTERSFLLVPAAQLTGGFAVAFWALGEYRGDFVVSIGGYHPQFQVPDHYPDHIPPLGVSIHLGPADLKGGMYFAITPQCLMMGGFLEASVTAGSSLHAFIKMALDAMLYFAPFHYDVMIAADAGVKVDISLLLKTIHIDVHLHLDVHIWGPEFSGTALLDVGPKTFDVAIGAAAENRPLPLSYDAFKEKFLQTVCTVSVTEGLLRKAEEHGVEIYVVDAEKMVVEARSTLPITSDDQGRLGIVPMDVRGGGFLSTYSIRGAEKFRREAIEDSVPSGLWGGAGLQPPDLSDASGGLVRDVCTGYRLTPGADRETAETHAIEKEKLAYNTDAFELSDQEVRFRMVEQDPVAVQEAPVATYVEYTGLTASDIVSNTGHGNRQREPIMTYTLS